MSDLTVVVPAYNEEESLAKVMPDILEYCGRHDFKLVVVDDGSTDESGSVLRQFEGSPCFTRVTHKVNRGYGAATKSGIRAADTPYVITIDADGQHVIGDIEGMYEAIVARDADMVVGSRMGGTSSGIYRNVGKKMIRWFAKILMPVAVQDLNSGLKIYRTELVKRYMRICPDHMAFSDIVTLVFISQRRLVMEVPISINPRQSGVSTVNTMTAVDTAREILNMVILFNPMRVFVPLALLFIAGSLAWGIPIVLAGNGLSTGALLGFVTGLLFFFLGLLAEQLSQLRKATLED